MANKNIKSLACLAALATCLASCVTTSKTAKTTQFDAATYTATVADLDVADQRVSVTLNPVPADVRRGGMSNIKKTVEAMALEQNGNADLLVNPEFTYTVERGFFSKRVTSMTVTGRPAKYKNFHSLNDSVWNNPIFRGIVEGVKKNRVKPHSPRQKVFAYAKDSSEDGYTPYRKGFTWGMDFGIRYDFRREKAVPEYLLNFGYHINPYIYVGAGSGAEWNTDDDWVFIPIYGNIRCYFSNKKSAPFLDLRVGGSTECRYSDIDGGTYGSISLGYSFKRFDLSLSYTTQKCKVTERSRYRYDGYYTRDENKTLNRLGLRLGFRL